MLQQKWSTRHEADVTNIAQEAKLGPICIEIEYQVLYFYLHGNLKSQKEKVSLAHKTVALLVLQLSTYMWY